jgi:amino acid transporter
MFIFICFQYILIIFVFNYKSVHRKHFSTNSILIIILLLILILILQFLFFAGNNDEDWIKNFVHFEDSVEVFDFNLCYLDPCSKVGFYDPSEDKERNNTRGSSRQWVKIIYTPMGGMTKWKRR